MDLGLINQASCGRLPQLETGEWTPPPETIRDLETALLERLVSELERDAAFFEIEALAPGDYIRRYAGFTADGHRLVAICAEHKARYDRTGVDWRTNSVLVRDGGSESFGAYYDPESREITYFEFGFVA